MNLPDKFFVKDKYGEVLLVTRDGDLWWVQEDYLDEDYDCWMDTSGTCSDEALEEWLDSGEYIRIPDDEGWISLDEVEL